MQENRTECWERHGFSLFPRAVTLFYGLRYLQWIDSLREPQEAEVHHQYLWDIRMYEPVYRAYREILGIQALWASLDEQVPRDVMGGVCLRQSVLLPAGDDGSRLAANTGDLFIFRTDRYRLDCIHNRRDWLPLTLIPADQDNDALCMQRLQSWSVHTGQTYLSSTGRKLLGMERWA